MATKKNRTRLTGDLEGKGTPMDSSSGAPVMVRTPSGVLPVAPVVHNVEAVPSPPASPAPSPPKPFDDHNKSSSPSRRITTRPSLPAASPATPHTSGPRARAVTSEKQRPTTSSSRARPKSPQGRSARSMSNDDMLDEIALHGGPDYLKPNEESPWDDDELEMDEEDSNSRVVKTAAARGKENGGVGVSEEVKQKVAGGGRSGGGGGGIQTAAAAAAAASTVVGVSSSSSSSSSFRRSVGDEPKVAEARKAYDAAAMAEMEKSHGNPDHPPPRYIDGMHGNMPESRKRWKKTLEFRAENAIEGILAEDMPQYVPIRQQFSHFFHGHGRSGSVCLYVRPGKSDFTSLFKSSFVRDNSKPGGQPGGGQHNPTATNPTQPADGAAAVTAVSVAMAKVAGAAAGESESGMEGGAKAAAAAPVAASGLAGWMGGSRSKGTGSGAGGVSNGGSAAAAGGGGNGSSSSSGDGGGASGQVPPQRLVNHDDMVRHFTFMLEALFQHWGPAMECKVGERDTECMQKMVAVFDLEGFHFSEVRKVFGIFKRIVQLLEQHYVGRADRIVVINAPNFRNIAFLVFPLVPKEVKEKIEILGKKYQKRLAEILVPEEIPQEYGGKCAIPVGQWPLEQHINAMYADPNRRFPTELQVPPKEEEGSGGGGGGGGYISLPPARSWDIPSVLDKDYPGWGLLNGGAEGWGWDGGETGSSSSGADDKGDNGSRGKGGSGSGNQATPKSKRGEDKGNKQGAGDGPLSL